MQTLPVNNNVETVQGNENDFLREMPVELRDKGVIPESVWVVLPLDQKKDILRQNGLLEKYSSAPTEVPVETIEQAPVNEIVQPVEEDKVEVISAVKSTDSEIAKMSEQLRESEMKFNEEFSNKESAPELSQDEKKRVAEETAHSSNTMNAPKLFGYQVSANTVQNAQNISDDGDITDGKTWTATLIKKIFAIFGE